MGGRLGAASPQTGESKSFDRARSLWLKAAFLLLACATVLYLGRQVVSIAVAKDQAATDPAAALASRPHDSAALEGLGERLLSTAKAPADVARVRDLAVSALDRSPLEVGAVRLLALVADRQGQADRAARLMTIAGARSERDGPAQAWLFDYWARRHNWPRAFEHADLLLRTHPQVTRQLDPTLEAAVIADPAARTALTARLAGAPFWREQFLSDLAQSNADPAPLLGMLNELNRPSAKLSNEEFEEVLVPLVNRHLYDEAYLTWVQSLPPKALSTLGNVYDPDFDGLPGAAPFNWTLHQPNGGRRRDRFGARQRARPCTRGASLRAADPAACGSAAESTAGSLCAYRPEFERGRRGDRSCLDGALRRRGGDRAPFTAWRARALDAGRGDFRHAAGGVSGPVARAQVRTGRDLPRVGGLVGQTRRQPRDVMTRAPDSAVC